MKIDFDKITYGDGHGNPFNHFKNIYYDGRYIGRNFVKSSFLTYNEKTVIYFSGSPWLTSEQVALLESSGCVKDDSAECKESDYPWMKSFDNNETAAILWWGAMIDALGLDLDYHYPVTDSQI